MLMLPGRRWFVEGADRWFGAAELDRNGPAGPFPPADRQFSALDLCDSALAFRASVEVSVDVLTRFQLALAHEREHLDAVTDVVARYASVVRLRQLHGLGVERRRVLVRFVLGRLPERGRGIEARCRRIRASIRVVHSPRLPRSARVLVAGQFELGG